MPTLIRLYVRTAFGYAVLGFSLGVVMLLVEAYHLEALERWEHALITTHTHVLTVGFITMMIIGVAYWMFPPDRHKRYSERLARWTFWLLNAGLLARLAGQWIFVVWPHPVVGTVMVVGGMLKLAALLLFIYNVRSRVRPPLRELIAKGELKMSDLEDTRI